LKLLRGKFSLSFLPIFVCGSLTDNKPQDPTMMATPMTECGNGQQSDGDGDGDGDND